VEGGVHRELVSAFVGGCEAGEGVGVVVVAVGAAASLWVKGFLSSLNGACNPPPPPICPLNPPTSLKGLQPVGTVVYWPGGFCVCRSAGWWLDGWTDGWITAPPKPTTH